MRLAVCLDFYLANGSHYRYCCYCSNKSKMHEDTSDMNIYLLFAVQLTTRFTSVSLSALFFLVEKRLKQWMNALVRRLSNEFHRRAMVRLSDRIFNSCPSILCQSMNPLIEIVMLLASCPSSYLAQFKFI
jgi:hypothetical protein